MRADRRVGWVSRRAFLGGTAGATVILPALQSLMPRQLWAQPVVQPRRFLAWFFPCGVPSINDWRPSATGADWEPSLLMPSVAGVRNNVSVLSGLRNEGRGPDHTYGTGAFLTGRLLANGSLGGPSIDQVIADGLQANGNGGAVHSLQLGVQDNVCEPNIDCFPVNNITYNDTGSPIAKQTAAADAFDGLFAGFVPSSPEAAAGSAERRALRTSVLDTVEADAASLRLALSTVDGLRLDEYLSSVRRTEQTIQGLADATVSCTPPDGIGDGDGIDAIINAHTEVMALAFECDLTRVITFMAASGATGRSRDYGNYHLSITHRADGDWERKFRETVIWEVEKFTGLVARLSTMTEVDGVTPVLENSALFFSSEISDGNGHNHVNMPVLLAGGLGGAITPGLHTAFSNGEYFADLFMYLSEAMGVPLGSFGANGAGRITSL